MTRSHRISLAEVTFMDLVIGFDGGGKLAVRSRICVGFRQRCDWKMS